MSQCGSPIPTSTTDSEESILREYVRRHFKLHEILGLLENEHGMIISLATLKRRLRSYGISIRNPHISREHVRLKLIELLAGPHSGCGYRHMWHALQLRGCKAPRRLVRELLSELDPQGVQLRQRRRLQRRQYISRGPNQAWHIDGYDKLKPFGFPISGCIDGWSRKLLWLTVLRSNNCPKTIGNLFLNAVQEFRGCPETVVTDLGTENGLLAAAQAFFRSTVSAHKYVSSPRNQRIESWWSNFRRSRAQWWMNQFKDLSDQGVFNRSYELDRECLWFVFAPLLQKDLNDLREHWNSHYIRRSRHETVAGRPDVLFSVPEMYGGISNLLLTVPEDKLTVVQDNFATGNQQSENSGAHVVDQAEDSKAYDNYFNHVMSVGQLTRPENWSQAVLLFKTLIGVSQHGYRGDVSGLVRFPA